MQPSRESSVLFALDELRDIEEIRKRDQREVARQQARERARVLAAEEEARAEAERMARIEASELVRLQKQLEDDARSRRILEAQLATDAQTNASLQSRLRLLEASSAAPSAALIAQSKANRIHASWAIALVATLGAFLVYQGTRSTPDPVIVTRSYEVPAPALAIADCPSALDSASKPTPVHNSASAATASNDKPSSDAAPSTRARSRTRGNGGDNTTKPPTSRPIDISGCADDPLGCMPE